MAINQKPKQLLNLDIQDEVVRANFDTLNRELTKRISSKEPTSANVVYSSIATYDYSLGGLLVPGTVYLLPQLTVTITTKGNPVNLKLLPGCGANFNAAAGNFSYVSVNFVLGGGNHDSATAYFGYVRSRNGESSTTISKASEFIEADNGVGTPGKSLGYPCCEIEDRVPAGTWTYTLYWQVVSAYAGIIIANSQLRALELK